MTRIQKQALKMMKETIGVLIYDKDGWIWQDDVRQDENKARYVIAVLKQGMKNESVK